MHHAFPNAVGTLSQRGRFHGWEKVHDAAAEVLHRGLWKPNGDEERVSGFQTKHVTHCDLVHECYAEVMPSVTSRHRPVQETQMQKTQRKRSLMMKQGK